MQNEFAKNEIDYIRRYEAVGFKDQYRIVDDTLENVNTNKRYAPEEVMILREHRYEGMSNPSDMSILYVLETMDGSKGTILASYGATSDNVVNNFMKAIPEENVTNDYMLPPDKKE